MVDARLPDGSRVNAIIPPLALDGPILSIRRFSVQRPTLEDLVVKGSLTEEIGECLKALAVGRLNILISGGTGAGKTTMLNILSGFIPATEAHHHHRGFRRIATAAGTCLPPGARPPNVEGKGEVTQRELVKNALRMRPDQPHGRWRSQERRGH